MTKDLLDAGTELLKNNSVLVTRKDKIPIGKWKHLQTSKMSPGEFTSLTNHPEAHGIGIAMLPNQEAIDLDLDNDLSGTLYNDYLDLVETNAPGLMARVRRHGTRSGGKHLLHTCDTVEGNQVLARRWDGVVLIETRGPGGYIMMPPSEGYSIENDVSVPHITVEERSILLDAARSLNQYKERETEPPAAIPYSGEERPGDDFSNRGDAIRVFTDAGWTKTDEDKERIYFLRPNSDSAFSGNWHKDLRLFYMFSSSFPKLKDKKAYRLFQVYAALHYDGDFRAAATQLRKEGYGSNAESVALATEEDLPKFLQIPTAIGLIQRINTFLKRRGIPLPPESDKTFFSEAVYSNLPEKLQRICAMMTAGRPRDIGLLGMIIPLSAAYSRYRFIHGSGTSVKEYSPNLMALVFGGAGRGKGDIGYGRELIQKIAVVALDRQKNSFIDYSREMQEYQYRKSKAQKSGNFSNVGAPPARPPKYCFEIAASDTTQAALVEVLKDNPAGGFAFDTEVDALVEGNGKKDFGGFSDILRKAFHHEPLSRGRKGEGETYIVPATRLSFIMSGTHDQLTKLIPSEENGLFSRIWFYMIPDKFVEYKGMTIKADRVKEACVSLQGFVLDSANYAGSTSLVSFTDAMENELIEAMQDKQDIENRYGQVIGASWIRIGIIVKRIAVTLGGFQGFDNGILPENCWRVAMELLPSIKAHCIEAQTVIRGKYGKIYIGQEVYNDHKRAGLTDSEAAIKMGISKATLDRRKKDWF